METTDAFTGLACRDCGATVDADATAGRCPDCGGLLDPTYDYDAVDLSRATLAERPLDSLWRYAEVLPFPRSAAVTASEGATSLSSCPGLADELGVDRLVCKDEGRNPTGTAADRGASVAMTAAASAGAETVALPSTGDGGQSVAAYAGRAGLDSQVFVPARSSHTTKSMINVHGGEMTVAGGRYPEAVGAYEDAAADDWVPLAPFETPYRHEGAKTILYELLEGLDWTVPDAVVVPTGHGVALVGAYKAATELRDLGLIDDRPALYAAQAADCAPVVEAYEAGAADVEAVETPDTICGGIEIPDPTAGSWILEAIRETGGGAVATPDEDVLDAAVAVAQAEGLEPTPSSAAAFSGAWALADEGAFNDAETVAVVNTGAGNKEADVLRSHLMRSGV